MGNTRSKSGGFTLVELMVVIAIIGILSAVIIPEMRGSRADAALRSTAREFISAFGIAGSRAITLHREHRIRFDSASGRFAVEQRDAPAGPDKFAPVRDVPGCDGQWDTRITVTMKSVTEESDANASPDSTSESTSNPADSIAFQPDGTADGVVVLLTDADGFRLALRLNPVTARTTLEDLGRP